MAEDLPNVTTVRIPLTGEPLENHDRILERRRRDRPRAGPGTGNEEEDGVPPDTQDDEQSHKLDVNA